MLEGADLWRVTFYSHRWQLERHTITQSLYTSNATVENALRTRILFVQWMFIRKQALTLFSFVAQDILFRRHAGCIKPDKGFFSRKNEPFSRRSTRRVGIRIELVDLNLKSMNL